VKNCADKAKGPCYEFSGRARMYRNKYIRIWKKGTNRLYQVARQTESAFIDLKHLSMATEIHALFDVCFLNPETPSGISEICIQSVKSAKTKHVPE
jgi:hypothetical protein